MIMAALLYGTHLYLKARETLGVESLSELFYVTFGRASVFLINALITFVIAAVLTLYLVLFSRICLSLAEEMVGLNTDSEQLSHRIFTSRGTYILVVAVALIPLFLRRKLSEMRGQTKILIAGVLLLVFVLAEKLYKKGLDPSVLTASSSDNRPYIEKAFDSANILLPSYGYMINLFPMADQLRKSERTRGN